MEKYQAAILKAVDDLFEEQVEFLLELAKYPSLRGEEGPAQEFLATELTGRGFDVDMWEIDTNSLSGLDGFSPVLVDDSDHAEYVGAFNVVGRLASRTHTGKSLILNGHIDVVPTGPSKMWSSPPFEPRIEDDWLYGRGVGDMKAGLSANLYAVAALQSIGLRPAADVLFQSVVEEECTGNGSLACLERGYQADAVLIPEPFNEHLVTAQVGVLWFQVRVQGSPTHVAYAHEGSNAIEAAASLFPALRSLELQVNNSAARHPEFDETPNALTLNIGKIRGGDWASSVPAWCSFDVRLGIFPGQSIDTTKEVVEETIRRAAARHPFLLNNLPEVVYNGFEAEGYSLSEDLSTNSIDAQRMLSTAHFQASGRALELEAITATTDARFFGLYGKAPALVYGPVAEQIHGFDERVSLESLRRVTKSIALFISNWCGIEVED